MAHTPLSLQIEQGATKTFTFDGSGGNLPPLVYEDTGLPIDLSLATTIRAQFKEKVSDPDILAPITKDRSNGIAITNAAGGCIALTLTSLDTLGVYATASYNYVFAIKIYWSSQSGVIGALGTLQIVVTAESSAKPT